MDSTVIVLIVIIVLLLLALGAAGLVLSRRRRSERLQEHYGPEYERSVRESGDRRSAEAELTNRERRVAELDIRDLRPEEREQYRASWSNIQQGFVDDPVSSVHAADRLVTDIMRTRGYPVDDFDRRADDISVAHPAVVQHYRDAREVRESTDRGQRVDSDQQRKAVISYRSLVDALLGSAKSDDRRDDDRRDDDRRTDDRRVDDRRTDERIDDRRTDDRRVDDRRTDERIDDRRADDRRYDEVADRRRADDLRGPGDVNDVRHPADDRNTHDRPADRPADDRSTFGHQTEERTR